jgi:hypothetical protein
VILTLLFRTRETAPRAETADLTTRTVVVVDTHEPSSSLTLRVVAVLSSLLHPALEGKIPMPRTEATATTWRCGMQPWPNNNSNKVQVSKPDRQVLDDDRRALTCDAMTVIVLSPGAVICMTCFA